MTDLGPLSIKLTAEGITEAIASFNNLEKAIDRTGKISKNMLQAMKLEQKERQANAKAATAEGKAKEDAARKSSDVEKAKAKEYLALKRNVEKEATNIAKQEAKERLKVIEKEAADHQRLLKSMTGAAARGARGFVRGFTRLGSAALALGGGVSIAGALDQERQAHQAATSLSVATNIPGGQQISSQDALNKAKGLAKEYNLSTADILEGQHQFIARGGAAATKQLDSVAPEMARIAKAEGVDPATLGEAMGIALKQNSSLNGEQLIGLMRVLVSQGKAGSVELRQLAPNLARTIASAPLYAGNQLDNQIKLAALAQKATATAGGPEEAATDVNKFGASIIKHKKLFAAQGITTTNAQGELLPIEQLLKNIFQKTGTNPSKIEKLFPDRGGLRLLESFLPDIKKNGLEKTIDELIQSFHSYLTPQEEAADLATIQNDSMEKLDKAFKNIEIDIGTALLPTLEKLVPKLIELIPTIVQVVDAFAKMTVFIAENPIKSVVAGLALAIGGAVVQAAVISAIGAIFAPEVLLPLIVAGVVTAVAGALLYKGASATEKGQIDAKNEDEQRAAKRKVLDTARSKYKIEDPVSIHNEEYAQSQMNEFEAEVKKQKDEKFNRMKELDTKLANGSLNAEESNERQQDKAYFAKELENQLAIEKAEADRKVQIREAATTNDLLRRVVGNKGLSDTDENIKTHDLLLNSGGNGSKMTPVSGVTNK